MGRGRRTAIGVAAMLAVVAIAPPLAAAKRDKYLGDIDPPFRWDKPTAVKFKVQLKKIKKGKKKKFVPLWVDFEFKGIPQYCTDGSTVYLNPGYPGIPAFHDYPAGPYVKKRKFFNTYEDRGSHYSLSGRIPRQGPATGTLRLADDAFINEDGELRPACDSGVVTWTANKI